jgi:hypothetical protein
VSGFDQWLHLVNLGFGGKRKQEKQLFDFNLKWK